MLIEALITGAIAGAVVGFAVSYGTALGQRQPLHRPQSQGHKINANRLKARIELASITDRQVRSQARGWIGTH